MPSRTASLELGVSHEKGDTSASAARKHQRFTDEDEEPVTPQTPAKPRFRVRLRPKRGSRLSRRQYCIVCLMCALCPLGILAMSVQMSYAFAPEILPVWTVESLDWLYGNRQPSPPPSPLPFPSPMPPQLPRPQMPPPPPPPKPSPPPPVPSPSPPPPRPVVDELNERFRNGRPNNNPSVAGVLLHQFDGQEDWNDQGWMPCTESSSNSWCASYSDRFASSIINAQMPNVFNDAGGLIFRTEPASLNRILCSFSADAGSMSFTCEPRGPSASCIPGCWNEVPNWCTAERPWQCAWRPTELRAMMEAGAAQSYNEVIVDTATYVQNLPSALMAIFVLDGSPSDQQQHAHEVHTRFLAHYASAGITAADVPLLRLTLNNHHTPFSVIVG